MSIKIIKSIILATSLAFSVTANAVVITENFTATVQSGTFVGTIGTGSFTYDDSLIVGAGNESIRPDNGLTVSFDVFGQLFTEQDDIQIFDSPPFPSLDFIDGIIIGLDFIVDELSATNPTAINQANVLSFSIDALIQGINGFEGELFVNEINTVPVPAAAWLFGSALLGFLGFSRKRKNS